MRRLSRLVGLAAVAAVGLVGAGAAAAQEGEGEGDGFVPGEATTVPVTVVPIDGEDTPIVTVPDTTTTTAPAGGPTTTALPAGCTPPPVPHAVFLGRLTAADGRTGRFTVIEVQSGSLSGFQIGQLVDVDLEDDVRYLEIDEEYLVAAAIADGTGRLASKVKPTLPRFGGDAVVGVDDRDVVCPTFDDAILTRMSDGSSVESAVLAPMWKSKSKLLRTVLEPAAVAFATLVAIVAIKHVVVWSIRRFRRWYRRRRAVAVIASPRGQPTSPAR